MTFSQYIVFNEGMYSSAVNDNAEDIPKVAVDAYSTVVNGVKFVFTFVDWGDQSLLQILGKMPELRMMLQSVSTANWNLLSVYFIISFRIPSTLQAFLGLYFVKYYIKCNWRIQWGLVVFNR